MRQVHHFRDTMANMSKMFELLDQNYKQTKERLGSTESRADQSASDLPEVSRAPRSWPWHTNQACSRLDIFSDDLHVPVSMCLRLQLW